MLFKVRLATDDARERQAFIDSLKILWEPVRPEEKNSLKDKLAAACGRNVDNETFFKVEFERVLELVEKRRVFLHMGMAYIPSSEQTSLVVNEFVMRLETALEVCLC